MKISSEAAVSIVLKNRAVSRKGFTLVELLVVIVILAILAAIVVPQFTSSTDDAKAATMKANLATMRNAIELYYYQHGNRYPGQYNATDGKTATATAEACGTAFATQLTQYTDKLGAANKSQDTANYPYAPYIKGGALPGNPFMEGNTGAAKVTCDFDIEDVTVTLTADTSPPATPSAGWKFYVKLGRLIANDGETSGGVLTSSF